MSGDVRAGDRRTGWPHVGGLHIHKAPTVMGREIEARQRERLCACAEVREGQRQRINLIGGIEKNVL
jgi:hypothetical protein